MKIDIGATVAAFAALVTIIRSCRTTTSDDGSRSNRLAPNRRNKLVLGRRPISIQEQDELNWYEDYYHRNDRLGGSSADVTIDAELGEEEDGIISFYYNLKGTLTDRQHVEIHVWNEDTSEEAPFKKLNCGQNAAKHEVTKTEADLSDGSWSWKAVVVDKDRGVITTSLTKELAVGETD